MRWRRRRATIETGASARLRAASRAAFAALTSEFDDVAGKLRSPGLTTLADELGSGGRTAHRRAERSPSTSPSPPTTRTPRCASSTGCSRARSTSTRSSCCGRPRRSGGPTEADLVDGVEHTARLALLKRAEVEDEVDEVEEQLFRFGRVLDAEPRLSAAAQRLHDAG